MTPRAALVARSRARRRALAILALAVTCIATPACDVRDALPPDPATVAHDADRARAAELRAHLVALPPVTGASVVIDRPAVEAFAPLGSPPPLAAPSVAIALVADPAADAARLDALARAAAAITVGADARVAVAVLPSPARPDLARLGPFTVAASARVPLLALIAGSLLAIAALALALTVVLARRR